MSGRAWLRLGWIAALAAAAGVRLWNALTGPLMWGYDAWAHVAYAIFLDIYRAVPWADQGWSYFHPPFHAALGWLLAQPGSGEGLMRGLALLGSAASLGTAGLAAWLVQRVSPRPRGLPLLAFASVAFLPVHFFVSPMPGNEMTLTFLTSAAVAVYIANEGRERPRLAPAAAAGCLLGLALLTKFSGVTALAALGAASALRAWDSRQPGNTNPLTWFKLINTFTEPGDCTNNLMPRNDRQLRFGKIAVDHMQVSAANAAS